jgi:hypothetical protein
MVNNAVFIVDLQLRCDQTIEKARPRLLPLDQHPLLTHLCLKSHLKAKALS